MAPITSRSQSVKFEIKAPEAESVFLATDLRILEDPKHSTPAESRWHAFATSSHHRPLSITFTIRHPLIRIISARPMNSRERKSYGY